MYFLTFPSNLILECFSILFFFFSFFLAVLTNDNLEAWASSEDFLRLGVGENIEHAVLLCNYFSWWDAQLSSSTHVAAASSIQSSWENYLLAGETALVRRSFWVLRVCRVNGTITDRFVYDPESGRSYSLDYDSQLMPLKAISILVTSKNVFFNVQRAKTPMHLDFDTTSPDAWVPLFRLTSVQPPKGRSNKKQAPTLALFAQLFGVHEVTSLQQADLTDVYQLTPLQARVVETNWGFKIEDIGGEIVKTPISAQNFSPRNYHVEDQETQLFYKVSFDSIALVRLWNTVAFQLDRLIRRNIESWRITSSTTVWSLGASKKLKELLTQLEGLELREAPDLIDRGPLTQIKSSFRSIHAFPLHFPCCITDPLLLETSDRNPIIHAIKLTKIHETSHPDTIFAHAVYIHPYTSKFASVWIIVANMLAAQ